VRLDHFSGSYAIGDSTVEDMPAAIALTNPIRRTIGGPTSTDATDYAAEIGEFETQAETLSLSSSDKVVNWDFGNHYFTLNADKAQGFIGFIQGQTLATNRLAAYLENPDYGIIMATALDDKDFDETENLLVTTTAYGRNDGQYDLVTETDGKLCYSTTNSAHLGPGDSYDESTGEGYSQTLFPQGVIALDLGASASAVSVTAVDALGRTAAVTVQSATESGRYIFEFNRNSYDFSSDTFGSDGSIDKTLWFKVAVTRDTDTDGDGLYDSKDNCAMITNVDQTDTDSDDIGDVCDDSDSDGSMDDADCDNANASVYPNATETCNNIDDDCNGVIDDVNRFTGTTYYRDRDGDGFGKKKEFVVSCSAPTGHVIRRSSGFDCNDSKARINPSAKEICSDAIDNDCDGAIDETDCTKMTVK
jgi:hypothetical protein